MGHRKRDQNKALIKKKKNEKGGGGEKTDREREGEMEHKATKQRADRT